MHNSAAQLLKDIDDFLARSGMSATALGREAVNDGHAVHALRDGKSMTLARYDKIRAFMASHSPPAKSDRRRVA